MKVGRPQMKWRIRRKRLFLFFLCPPRSGNEEGEGGRLHTPVQSIYKPERDREGERKDGRGRRSDADAGEGDCARAPFAASARERATAGVRDREKEEGREGSRWTKRGTMRLSHTETRIE